MTTKTLYIPGCDDSELSCAAQDTHAAALDWIARYNRGEVAVSDGVPLPTGLEFTCVWECQAEQAADGSWTYDDGPSVVIHPLT